MHDYRQLTLINRSNVKLVLTSVTMMSLVHLPTHDIGYVVVVFEVFAALLINSDENRLVV